MENMKADIEEIRRISVRKTPQSHGGVANLLKVLTKTMEKQGSDIEHCKGTVCGMRAGRYLYSGRVYQRCCGYIGYANQKYRKRGSLDGREY